MLNKSYAYWKMSYQQTEVNRLASECFEMQFSDTDAIKLNNVMSILNSEGEQLKPYNVTIKNICDNDIKYQVNIETLTNNNQLADKYITAKVNYENNKVLTSYDTTEGIIPDHSAAYKVYEGHLKKDQVMSIDVRMWMGEEVELYETVDGIKKDISKEIMNKEFQSKVTIEAEVDNQEGEYKEEILHGTDPVLGEGLIPVIIGEKGTVTRADTTKKWYNYANSEWANAVILKDEATNKNPNVGETIQEEDIESYFVWIPKYSYQIQTLRYNSEQTFSIRFGTTDTDDSKPGECTTPMNEERTQGKSGDNGECQVGDYMTHPAFISMKTNGLWVGKFETGYKEASSIETAQQNPDTRGDKGVSASEKIIIKPNTYTWTNISIANAFQASYQYQRGLDSHMIKNTEWGAVAYLSHSKYGKYTLEEGNTEVRVNNVKGITGHAQKTETFEAQDIVGLEEDGVHSVNYKNPLSQEASTTGNYTGIYDMSGGVPEGVMATMYESTNTTPTTGPVSDANSGFNGPYAKQEATGEKEDGIEFPEEKYYDVYLYGTNEWADINRRILGDATAETNRWYSDNNQYVLPANSWFARGDAAEIREVQGIFAYRNNAGKTINGFRIVLASQSKS